MKEEGGGGGRDRGEGEKVGFCTLVGGCAHQGFDESKRCSGASYLCIKIVTKVKSFSDLLIVHKLLSKFMIIILM